MCYFLYSYRKETFLPLTDMYISNKGEAAIMGKIIDMNRYVFLEKQVKYYMQILLVQSPDQVLEYFENQVSKYTSMLKRENLYPAIVVDYIQKLIEEYSLRISRIKEYINYKNENCFSNALCHNPIF
jgi:hypothetical protein